MAYRLIFIGLAGALLSAAFAQTRQYYFVNLPKTWTAAQTECRRNYTDLATIESIADVNVVISTSPISTGMAWIGLYDELYNSWKWSLNDDGFYGVGGSTFRNWISGSPNNLGGQQHCVRLLSDATYLGGWDDRQCTDLRPFLCYSGMVNGSPTYIVNTTSLNWTDAQTFCRKNYIDLASIRNQAENDNIKNLLGGIEVWIGLYREKLWSDGSTSLFRYWAAGRPVNNYAQCVAAEFSDSGRWFDNDCTQTYPFICYRPIPPNAGGFIASGQNQTSITLRWNKVNVSFVLQFNGTETNISPPTGDGPVTHTVSSLTAGTNYTFTLFSVLNNVKSSGITITVATAQSPTCAETGCPSGMDCITVDGAVQCINPCDHYTVLNDTWRSLDNTNNTILHCDQYVSWSGWYRFFLGQTSAQIPETCPKEQRCGTHAPLWITEPHPTQTNLIVNRTVCNAWSGSCCQFQPNTIQVTLCYGHYYVYKLTRPSTCYLAYCAVSAPQNAEGFRAMGQNETTIVLQWNKLNNNVSFVLEVNGTETNISSPNGNGPVTHTVSSLTAGTKYTFTLFSVFGIIRSSGVQLTAVTAPLNTKGFAPSGQNETSIVLRWNKVNNVSFVLQFNGSETNISASDKDGPVTHTVSSLTAGTKYTFTLFSVFENVRSSGIELTAVTAPPNPEGLKPSGLDETSITLQWKKVNSNISFVLQFNGSEVNISSPTGDGPVTLTVSSLTAGTKYTFTLFSVFENVRSSGISITAATGPSYVLRINLGLRSSTELSKFNLEDILTEIFRKSGLSPESYSLKIVSIRP